MFTNRRAGITANIWASTLDSNAEIRIGANFDPLLCTADRIVLGSAGAGDVFFEFNGAEFPLTSYVSALANKRAGRDLDSSTDDISARFNSSYGGKNPDGTDCAPGRSYYYGLDANEALGQADLVAVALHEFGHGLGFAALVNVSTGANQVTATIEGNTVPLPSVFSRYLLDIFTGKHFNEMTNDERKIASLNVRRIVWDGMKVTEAIPSVLQLGTPILRINAPQSIARLYPVGTAEFGPALSNSGITGTVIQANDGDATPNDACQPLTNAAAINGNIAIVDRGNCNFTIKVKNAQNAGATAVLVADNAPGNPPSGLGGEDPSITIPAVRISQTDGNAIKSALASDAVSATLQLDATIYSGADAQNRALINITDPVVAGSSVSHYDPIARPNQLMEPAINPDLTHSVQPPQDLTLPLMRDIGWFPDVNLDNLPDDLDNSPGVLRASIGSLSRDCATKEFIVNITLTNVGTSTINNVQLYTARLGKTTLSRNPETQLPLSFFGKIAPGASITRTLRIPGKGTRSFFPSRINPRISLRVSGTETTTFRGGTFDLVADRILTIAPDCGR